MARRVGSGNEAQRTFAQERERDEQGRFVGGSKGMTDEEAEAYWGWKTMRFDQDPNAPWRYDRTHALSREEKIAYMTISFLLGFGMIRGLIEWIFW